MRSRDGGWRLSTTVNEGLTNWFAGRFAVWLVSGAFVAAGASIAVADTTQTVNLATHQRMFIAAGGDLLVASNKDAGVSMTACEELNRLSAVNAAAALTPQAEPVGLAAEPDADLLVTTSTAGIARLLDRAELGATTLVDPETARELGLTTGGWVAFRSPRYLPGEGPVDPSASSAELPEAPMRIAVDHGLSILGSDLGSGAIVPTSAARQADYCIVRASGGNREAVRDALPALLADHNRQTPTVVADQLVTGQFAADYPDQYTHRLTRFAPWAVGWLLGLLWWLLAVVRRSQDALYATLGAPYATRSVIRATELIGHVAFACVVATPLAVAVCFWLQAPPSIVWPSVIGNIGATEFTALLVGAFATLVPVRSPLAALKDR